MLRKRHGIVTAVAIESILKSLFLIIGIYVTYFVFDGFDDIYVKAALLDNFDKKNYWRPSPRHELVFFAFYRCLLSFFYPDNFILQLLKIIAKTYSNSTMAFPLYLLLLIFSSSQLLGGNILLKERSECRYLFPINTTIF
jgi:hypothetical protein